MFLLLLLSLEVRRGCPNQDIIAGADQCFLTPKLGGYGTQTFLEDCEGLGKVLILVMFACGVFGLT